MAKSSVAASENGNRFLNVPFVTAVLLGGTLLATGLGAYFSYRQWQTSESYNQKSMRAYVFLRDIKLERGADGIFDIIPQWENSGNSETLDMNIYLNSALTPNALDPRFSFADFQPMKLVPFVLGPKVISDVSVVSVPEDCLKQFNRRDGIGKFYIWGWAKYRDSLTPNDHLTRFCWDIRAVTFSEDGKSGRLFHSLCDLGNCADGQCKEPEPISIQFPNVDCKSSDVPQGEFKASTVKKVDAKRTGGMTAKSDSIKQSAP